MQNTKTNTRREDSGKVHSSAGWRGPTQTIMRFFSRTNVVPMLAVFMNYLVFAGFGLVLLAAIGLVVGWASTPKASLTVHAIRPMGTNCHWETPGGQSSWPVWQVEITNSGREPVEWYTSIRVKDKDDIGRALSRYPHPRGSLSPGQHVTICMPAPSDSGAIWRARLSYCLPGEGVCYVFDNWRAGTNVISVH